MGWFKDMFFKLLKIEPAGERQVIIKEPLSFQGNVLKKIRFGTGEIRQSWNSSLSRRHTATYSKQGFGLLFHFGK